MRKFKEQPSRCICLEDINETETNQFQKEYEFANSYTLTKLLKE